jgi:flagellar protein FlgJ
MPDKYPTTKDFLLVIKPFAMVVETNCGIPWLMTGTQAAHESRNGNSLLTVQANNLFGMTGDSWQKAGKPVYVIQTKEFNAEKVPYFVSRPFRKYASWTEALADWQMHILTMYKPAFICAHDGDANGFFDALQAGGYATDPQYAEQLKERYMEIAALFPDEGTATV